MKSVGSSDRILEVRGLSKSFGNKQHLLAYLRGKKRSVLNAVTDVSFWIRRGETLGLVGESGCGKSTLGKCLMRLHEPTAGRIFFQDQDILAFSKNEQQQLYTQMQMIFQDPYSSLNPRMSVFRMLAEAMKVHAICRSKKEMNNRVEELMEKVGLAPRLKHQLPYAFSGGQRQRISIARALSVNPDFIVADEPTSALDVSIQAQILNLLIQLQDEMNLTYLFISHDLSVVRYISHRIAVMYLGQIVELADADTLFSTPLHPYAKALLAAVPLPDPQSKSSTEAIAGDLPHPGDNITGCRFHSRCDAALDICAHADPDMYLPASGHAVRCFLYK